MILWLVAIVAVALGALCSSWFMVFVGGGWKQGVIGYVAWALMPYAVLTVILLTARSCRFDRPVHNLSTWASIVIALGGPLRYFDAMFVHVDAQGMLGMLMVPIVQPRSQYLRVLRHSSGSGASSEPQLMQLIMTGRCAGTPCFARRIWLDNPP